MRKSMIVLALCAYSIYPTDSFPVAGEQFGTRQSSRGNAAGLLNRDSLVGETVRGSLDSIDYFPLQVNNEWIYFDFDMPPYFFPDSMKILGTQSLNDTLYYLSSARIEGSVCFPKYLRKDSTGNVYARFGGMDQLLYKVNATAGEQWQDTLNTSSGSKIVYTISMINRDAEIETYTGIFRDCLQLLLWTQDLTEATYYVWLAPAVGIVRIDGWGIAGFSSLKRAIIDKNLVSARTFQVLSVSPAPEEKDVNDSTEITFTFVSINKPMIGDSNLSVISGRKGKITGTLTFDGDSRSYIFVPEYPLPESDTITVTLSASITDIYGDSLDGDFDWGYEGAPADDYSWRFFTGKVDPVRDRHRAANEFRLNQNYPNPFNPSTTIQYELSERVFVELSVYDVLGRKVKTLVREFKYPGIHEARLEGGDLPSGIYIYRLTAGGNVLARKAMLIK